MSLDPTGTRVLRAALAVALCLILVAVVLPAVARVRAGDKLSRARTELYELHGRLLADRRSAVWHQLADGSLERVPREDDALDPWGRAYRVVFVPSTGSEGASLVLSSAGPDGILESAPSHVGSAGRRPDDVVLVIPEGISVGNSAQSGETLDWPVMGTVVQADNEVQLPPHQTTESSYP